MTGCLIGLKAFNNVHQKTQNNANSKELVFSPNDDPPHDAPIHGL